MKQQNTKGLWLLTAASLLALAACGGGNGGQASSTSPQDASASAPAQSSDQGQKSASQSTSVGPGTVSSSQGGDSSVPAAMVSVTFNYNYPGSRPTQVKVEAGSTVEKPADPVREGYGFTGWYTEIGCVNLFDFNTPIAKNTVLFAGWSESNLTVSFNYNYVGAPAITTVTVAKGSSVAKPADPERENYTFEGWYLEAAGEHEYDFTLPVMESFTLYAKWTLSVATVTFDLGYETENRTSTVSVRIGEAVAAPAEPRREGYDFLGWFRDANDSVAYDFSSIVSDSFTLTAKWEIIVLTVTFNYNYAGANSSTVNVNYGEKVDEPTNTRTGYICAWMLNDAEFDFDTPITESITLVASWTAESSDSYTYTYYYNYTGAPNNGVYKTDSVKKQAKPARPSDPTRDGYYFSGWYTDADCTTAFNFNARATSAQSAYAKWLDIYTLEAEYIDLDGKMGFGFSVNLTGTDLIYPANGSQASNGYYVSGMYYENAELEFDFNVDKDVDDAVITMRIQCEFDTKTFNPDTYTVEINGVALDYEEITIEGLEEDTRSDVRRPFINVQMNDRAVLNKGPNVLKLITTNNVYHGNTRQADAPMLDCVYVATDAKLTWSPKVSNLEGK
jgi:uncharacterized repeat protein (TIGR02543 family)